RQRAVSHDRATAEVAVSDVAQVSEFLTHGLQLGGKAKAVFKPDTTRGPVAAAAAASSHHTQQSAGFGRSATTINLLPLAGDWTTVLRCLRRPAEAVAMLSGMETAVGEYQDSELRCSEAPRWPLPVKRLSLPSTKPQLSEEQAAVLRAVLKGQSIFFTGSAGTGKSYLLKRILGSLPPTGTVATASTGVAACHIGGTTLHAFAGIGSGQAPLAQCVALAQRPGVRQGWLNCQRLVIDEISMVEADLFDKLEAVARAVRQQNKPFGGIQLIICGDFLQLPPVTKGFQPPRFCFQAKSWKRCVPVTLELTKVWRQADQTFISLLQAVRLGRCSDEVTRQLQATASHKVGRDGIVATRLCTHQDDVALTNERRLQELPGKVHRFEAMDSNPELASILDAQCPVSQLLQLKLGAQVMLVKNLSVSRGLVNGARGVVVGFEAEGRGLPQVRFLCGVTEVIRADRWTVQATRNQLLSRQQLPLQLAWAMSIHKSQGMTLDCVEISLGRVFASGQAYVALSRARSLQGLRVLDFDPVAVRCDPRVLHFYATLQRGRGLSLESPDDDEAASDQENVDPNL
ncbi:PREDICTED: ATP-dependent DNA helicase PIF1, partial [Mandrillus leucophaeus]|uniref:ATP-dependent DNA helicase PIF1 n=1 Tax=Mandrillus leucophaeus TaxID=9568 RepID=UPI0005F43A29